ncbi:LPS export ABC transporter ATP-binding protein [Paraphotobacterium marinum]|uniref:LPS export ABC transporter ATP-binding protein n=1 Tax=Paraphotobacterium marinum TaxID=1755811 RepID=UPI0039E7F24D
MSTLKVQNLKKSYKKRTVVSDFNVEVSTGEVIGLLGPNGAGKTTAFYMIIGLVQSDSGAILLDGKNISDKPMNLRARAGLGYLPQENSIFRKLTVKQNILAVLETIPALSKKQRLKKCHDLLEEFNITHIIDSMGISLSGGERRRVEIARALATDPKFILLDEPFAGVDPISVIDIKKHISHLKERGIGVLITDHNVRETLDVCERACILSSGHIIASGSPDDILNNESVRKVYLGDHFSV